MGYYMNRTTKTLSISLEPEVIKLMESIGQELGTTSKSQVVRMAIKQLAKKLGIDNE